MNPTILCLFSTGALRQASCFAGADSAWSDRTDHGWCRYLSLALDAEGGLPGADGLRGAIVAVDAATMAGDGLLLRDWLDILDEEGVPTELATSGEAVAFLTWLTRTAPGHAANFNPDGIVRLDLPSWWRRRAETILAREPGGRTRRSDESSTGMFSAEMVRQYAALRRAGAPR